MGSETAAVSHEKVRTYWKRKNKLELELVIIHCQLDM